MGQEEIWLIILHLPGKFQFFFSVRMLQIFNLIPFCSFFPNVLQPPMAVLGNSIHKLLVKARICRRTVKQVNVAVAPTGVTVSLPGLDPHDMERRR